MARLLKTILFVALAFAGVPVLAHAGAGLAGETAPLLSDKDAAGARHYTFALEKDLPLTFFAAFGSIYGNYRLSRMSTDDASELPAVQDLLPWDRPVAGRYNKAAGDVSSWLAVLGVAPLALAGYSWYRDDACGRDLAVYSLMFAQAVALQSALNLTVRSMKFWPRPYIYATEGAGAEAAKDADGEAYGSFFSGHTSAAFTVAMFTGEWFSEMYPNSRYKPLVWASSLSLAGFVGALRIAAGKHYVSDVVVGALAGVGISAAVIEIHKKPVRIGPVSLSQIWAGPGAAGTTFVF